MKNRINFSNEGYVLSPFGNFGDTDPMAIFNSIVNAAGQVAGAVTTAIKAGQPTATPMVSSLYQNQPNQSYQNQNQSQPQYIYSQSPNMAAPSDDKTLLYVAGGLGALLVVLMLARR